MKIGDDSFAVGADGKVRFAYARRATKPAKRGPPSLGERNRLSEFVPHGKVACNSEGDIIKLRDGRLCCVWNDHESHPNAASGTACAPCA